MAPSVLVDQPLRVIHDFLFLPLLQWVQNVQVDRVDPTCMYTYNMLVFMMVFIHITLYLFSIPSSDSR